MVNETSQNEELLIPTELVRNRIRQERIERGWTQELMAHSLGLSTKAYSNIENKAEQDITLLRIVEIAKIFSISWYDLLLPKTANSKVINGNVTANYSPYSTNKSDINIYEKDTKTSLLQEKIKGLNDKVEALEKEIAYLKLLNQNGIKI
jgi:transcriptional regulator with XRE-family HTH domain